MVTSRSSGALYDVNLISATQPSIVIVKRNGEAYYGPRIVAVEMA